MSLRRASHLAWRRILDETIVLDLRRRRAHGVNPAGGRILEWLERPRSREALLGTIAQASVQEVEGFLSRVLEEGLVVESEEPATGLDAARGDPGSPSDPPRILWSEELPRLAQQTSPPMQIGDRQCAQ